MLSEPASRYRFTQCCVALVSLLAQVALSAAGEDALVLARLEQEAVQRASQIRSLEAVQRASHKKQQTLEEQRKLIAAKEKALAAALKEKERLERVAAERSFLPGKARLADGSLMLIRERQIEERQRALEEAEEGRESALAAALIMGQSETLRGGETDQQAMGAVELETLKQTVESAKLRLSRGRKWLQDSAREATEPSGGASGTVVYLSDEEPTAREFQDVAQRATTARRGAPDTDGGDQDFHHRKASMEDREASAHQRREGRVRPAAAATSPLSTRSMIKASSSSRGNAQEGEDMMIIAELEEEVEKMKAELEAKAELGAVQPRALDRPGNSLSEAGVADAGSGKGLAVEPEVRAKRTDSLIDWG